MLSKLLTVVIAVFFLASCAGRPLSPERQEVVTVSPEFDYEARKRVAVFPFENEGRGDTNRMITENFSARLLQAGFSVVDSRQLEQVARVAGIPLTRLPSLGDLAKIGKELKVNTLITGSCIVSKLDRGDELTLSMISARFQDIGGQTVLYAVVRPDGVTAGSRKLVGAVRAAIMNDLFAKGNAAFDRGDLKKAIDYYTSLLRLDPTLINALRNRGVAFAQLKDYRNALSDFDQAIDLANCTLLNPSPDLMECLMKSAPYWRANSVMPDPSPGLIADQVTMAKKAIRAQLLLNRAIALSLSGSYDAAIQDLDRALDQGADPGKVFANRAVALVKLNRLKEAIDDYNKSIKFAPDRPDSYYQLGLLLEKDHPDEAMQDFTKAVSLDRRFAKAYAARARLKTRKGQLKEAIDDYSVAITLEPENIECLNGRAALLASTGDKEGAASDYSRTIKVDEVNAEALIGRGAIYSAMGEDGKADMDFEKALRGEGLEKGRAYVELGRLREKEGSYSEAITAFSKAIDILGATSGTPYSERGATRIRLADYRGSELDITRALQISDNNTDDYFNRGYSRMQLGKYRQSIDDFSRAATLTPGYQPAFSNRAFAQQQSGNYQEAINDYSKAIALQTDKESTPIGGTRYPDPKLNKVASEYRVFFTYSNRGESYRALGQYEHAIDDFDQAIHLSPKDPEVYVRRGMTYQESGNLEKALADFNKAIELDRYRPDAYYARGLWYEQKSEFSSARNDYSTAISLKPDFAQAFFSRGLLNMQTDHHADGLQDIKTAARMGIKKAQDYLLTGGMEW